MTTGKMNRTEFDSRPIGIFDSGLGGLTVAAQIIRTLPSESIVYLGDTARVPYGNRSRETLIRYAREDAAFLRSRNVKMILAACNTVSATALEQLKAEIVDVPVCGVIEAGVVAASAEKIRSILVIGTRATIASGAYQNKLKEMNPELQIFDVACPLLVPLAEEGIVSGEIVKQVFDLYLKRFKIDPPDAVLLGCTHYPLFKNALNEYFSYQVKIIDSAASCAEYIRDNLNSNILFPAPENNVPDHHYFATDLTKEFRRVAANFMGSSNPPDITKISLQE